MATRSEEDKLEYSKLKCNISYNIKKYRKEKHLTQEELAEKSDISYDFLRRIESTKGRCGFSVYTLYKLSLALNVSLDDLMERDIKALVKNK